ncbi:MAG: MBOAT family protein [Oscillospiraceae bacterium]|nr:MBOAT family protein [Oscillospiraceae bacterium]
MLFNSLEFLIFFPIVVLLYFVIPKKIKYLWLLAASYYFYMCWNAKYALLLLFSTAVTFTSGLCLQTVVSGNLPEKKKTFWKKFCVAASFLLNLAVLVYFKYTNFALDALSDIFSLLHIQLHIPEVDILLPVGISFFTFQALSYTMDVYRGDIYAEKNFFRYALFVSFFPQLVAGPIERSKNLLKQLAVPKPFSFENLRKGILLMLWGFFLKLVISDRLAIFVNTVYGNYGQYPGFYLLLATVMFAFQIYCDFYGYSIIASGAAKIIGIDLMENFHAPYLATSVSGFWRNWHISLTSWFKDYLYIPLGGSRKGAFRKHLNRIIVFLVSGLWHGANWTFVVWGGLNGLYQVLGDLLKPVRDKAVSLLHLNRQTISHRTLQILTTFLLVCFSWIFFRANSITQAFHIVKSILCVHNVWILFDGSLFTCGLDAQNFNVLVVSLGVLFFADICKQRKIVLHEVILRQDYWVRWLVISLAACAVLLFGIWGTAYDAASFIYFQF